MNDVKIQGRNSIAESWVRSHQNCSPEISLYGNIVPDYLLQTNKQVPGRLDPHEVEVAGCHQANNEADEGEDEERRNVAEDYGVVSDDNQEI